MIRSDNPSDNGVSGAMYLFGTALLWSFIGILVRANSQSALLIGAVTAIFMALFILLVGRLSSASAVLLPLWPSATS